MLPLPVVSESTHRPFPRPELRLVSGRQPERDSDVAATRGNALQLDARRELSRLDRDQLAELTAVLLEAMPNSYQWSVVAAIRREQPRHRPAEPIRLQRH